MDIWTYRIALLFAILIGSGAVLLIVALIWNALTSAGPAAARMREAFVKAFMSDSGHKKP